MAQSFVLVCQDAQIGNAALILGRGIVGRLASCDYVIADSSVSRQHAEIYIFDGQLIIEDLGSRNGTFVDEVRIRKALVVPGQTIRFGSVRFVLATSELPPGNANPEVDTDVPLPEAAMSPADVQRVIALLTQAQCRVFDQLLRGKSNKEIVAALGVSHDTVKRHIQDILGKFAVPSVKRLLARMLEQDPTGPVGRKRS